MNAENPPLVTIVTPTYNNAEYLSETIESVLSQAYPNIEYIVINDGSTDNTKEVLAEYTEKCTVIHQDNVGQSATLNRGWAMAKGSILGYISSDDRLKPECIAEAVEALNQFDLIVATYCDFDLIDSNGRFIRSVLTEKFDAKRLTEDLVCQPGPGAFFRAESFKSVGGWDMNLRQTPDFEFWLRLQLEGEFYRISKNLADFRIHKNSTSSKVVSRENSNEMVEVVKAFVGRKDVLVDSNKAVSNAHFIAARSHFQSQRLGSGFHHLLNGLKNRPSALFGLMLYRSLFSGLFRRLYYSLRTTREAD